MLIISRATFRGLIRRLSRDGDGRRESGAFLLAPRNSRGQTRVIEVAFYSDLDPRSLTGGIDFHADGYTELARICEERDLVVVADIHTHPYDGTGQSQIDRAHPMIAMRGHVAFIAPRFAQGRIRLPNLGAHLYRGDGNWSTVPALDLLRYSGLRDLVNCERRAS